MDREIKSAHISSKNIIHCPENTSLYDSYVFIFLFGPATDLSPNNYWSPCTRLLKTEFLLYFKALYLLQRWFLSAIRISIMWIIYLSEMAYLLEIGNNFQRRNQGFTSRFCHRKFYYDSAICYFVVRKGHKHNQMERCTKTLLLFSILLKHLLWW